MLTVKQVLTILNEPDEKERERMIAKLSCADAKMMLRYVLKDRFRTSDESEGR